MYVSCLTKLSDDHLVMIVLSMKNTVRINFYFEIYVILTITGSTNMYQAFHLERNPMYVLLNLKFMYQMAGAVLSLLMCDRL